MEDIKNYDVYNKEMKKSMQDKVWFIDKIIDCKQIIDYGCADGSLIKYIEKIKPNFFNLIGIDIDKNMLNLAFENFQKGKFFSPSDILKKLKNNNLSCLNLSSVIHEIYSYGNQESIDNFWEFVFNSNFKYIAIRDMALKEKDYTNTKTYNALISIFEKNKKNISDYLKFLQFCQINKIENLNNIKWKDIIHYFLKYRYKENWDREVQENYIPLSIEKIYEKIPQDKYKIKYFNHYTLPFLKKTIKQDFLVNIYTPTHFKILLEKI